MVKAMGARKKRREAFFREHPNCCFCGGDSPATTEDHQPARTYFKNRTWPEGFVFPACDACNGATRQSEKVLSILINGYAESEDRRDYQKLIASIRSEYPDLIRSMIPNNPNEVRRLFRENSLEKPTGATFRDLPIVKLNRKFWEEHIINVAKKIMIALHYKCFKTPLSPNGGATVFIHTNFDWAAGKFPQEILELAGNHVRPIRQKQFLDDQFSVRWSHSEDPRSGLFIVHLQGALTIIGITNERATDFRKGTRILKPWSW